MKPTHPDPMKRKMTRTRTYALNISDSSLLKMIIYFIDILFIRVITGFVINAFLISEVFVLRRNG